jgi:hypothetical protein
MFTKKSIMLSGTLNLTECPAWDNTLLTVGFSLRHSMNVPVSPAWDDTKSNKCCPCGT